MNKAKNDFNKQRNPRYGRIEYNNHKFLDEEKFSK